MTSKTKSWRDVLPIHPAAELFPRMSEAELRELGEDIRKYGLREGVALLDGKLLDGRSRLDAMEMAGIKLVTNNGQPEWANIPHKNVQGVDPFTFVVSKNIHRRHLSADHKRELIEKLVKASPERSDRQIAGEAKSNRTTVGQIRKTLEMSGDVSIVDTRRDTKGRRQKSHKPSTTSPASAAAIYRAVARSEEIKRQAPVAQAGTASTAPYAVKPQELSIVGSITHCTTQVRATVLNVMQRIKPAEWPQLIAALRDEIDDIEKSAEGRGSRGRRQHDELHPSLPRHRPRCHAARRCSPLQL